MPYSKSFKVSTMDGCRLIEISWPGHPSVAELRDFVFALYDLWDSEPDTPSVALNDLRTVESLTPEEFEITRIILARMRMHSAFVAGAFFTGDNETLRRAMTQALEAAKRPTESLCRTRGEALAYLKSEIVRREQAVE